MFRFDRIALLGVAALFAACSAETPAPAAETPAPPAAVEQAAPAPGPAGVSAMPPVAKAPANAEVYFISPADGDEIEGDVTVVFGLRNMGVAPAGVTLDHTGHHHLLINEPEVAMDRSLPATEQIIHFGGGQTEATLSLPAGTHTLQLLLGDALHQPHDPPVMSEKITITVQ